MTGSFRVRAIEGTVADITFLRTVVVRFVMAIAAAGYKAVKEAVNAIPGVDTDQAAEAIDRETLETAIDQQGIEAVTDEGVLRATIDPDALDAAVDFDELRNSVADGISTDDQQY